MLIVDRAARTIYGRAIPFDVVAAARMRLPERFPPGSLTWGAVVPLLIEHDESLRVGTAVGFEELRDGLWVTFRVRRGPRGDRGLALAAATHTGLSIGDADGEFRIAEDGVRECVSTRITEISLTKNPVFA